MKSINENFNINDNSALEERLANELEERLELGCWIYCGAKDCVAYNGES
ncbi:hypothetical protein [Acetivibrio clariflavus]|uniref:Uncharacterized protein n=1 Tax=Acetivibrio clariflavus (strain DSM 19732 / NBRC 101661 / EBR45) TaxID=720554 RepID=G8M1M6_ACECE|nr:hypothetical protein [Acetivibrio clariflavus]AEV70255.1 hypothetical protein Clocl_3805 [Acetivibrio clariflavus DSM 19732]